MHIYGTTVNHVDFVWGGAAIELTQTLPPTQRYIQETCHLGTMTQASFPILPVQKKNKVQWWESKITTCFESIFKIRPRRHKIEAFVCIQISTATDFDGFCSILWPYHSTNETVLIEQFQIGFNSLKISWLACIAWPCHGCGRVARTWRTVL